VIGSVEDECHECAGDQDEEDGFWAVGFGHLFSGLCLNWLLEYRNGMIDACGNNSKREDGVKASATCGFPRRNQVGAYLETNLFALLGVFDISQLE